METHPCCNTFKGLVLLSRLRARKKTNKPTHSFSKGSQGAFQGLRGYRRRRVCIKPGTYTDRALRKAVKGFLPQGGSPIAVLVFVSALTSLICWGRGTRGNEAKLETTLTKVMRTRRDEPPRCHCRCLPGAVSLRSHQCLASPPLSRFHFQLRKKSGKNKKGLSIA